MIDSGGTPLYDEGLKNLRAFWTKEPSLMRLFLNIILIFITILACSIEDIYLYFWPPAPEKAVYLTIRSRRNFSFDQQKALEDKRIIALAQYVPVYRYRSQSVGSSKKKFEEFSRLFINQQEDKQTGAENLRNQVQKKFGVGLTQANIISIIKYRDLKNLLEGILTIEESILQNKIVHEPQNLMGKKTIEILSPNSAGMVTHPVDELITLEKARFLLEEKVRQLFWQVDKKVLDPVLQQMERDITFGGPVGGTGGVAQRLRRLDAERAQRDEGQQGN